MSYLCIVCLYIWVIFIFIIMAKIKNSLTPNELMDNYEYKVTKRVLMNEFPWIKGVTVNDGDLQTYNLIFLNLIIDPTIIKKQYGWDLNPWVNRYIKDGESYNAAAASIIFNVTYDESRNTIVNPITTMMEQIHNSPAIPTELKLPEGRQLSLGNLIINPTENIK